MSRKDATPPPRPAPAETATSPAPGVLRSGKILDRHREALALVYVRQSSPHQVLHHRESRERQYALAGHAAALGWPADRVVVIDDDQGQSGKTADQRGGFHRLLAEVTMGHVGLVLGIEMSRLARSNKDWHHLLEMCAVFGTLLADEDGLYDPNDSNDRLLLGLKGTISEFELVTMRNRLERGRQHKAQRGELFYGVPVGYVKLPTGQVEREPDEQARAVVQLIFDKFAELGTTWGVFRYLLRNNVRLGMRARTGAHRGQLEWRRPSLATLATMLHHPIYAGAYAHGRNPVNRRRPPTPCGAGARTRTALDQIPILLRDRLPAYITWEQYLANLERLRSNQTRLRASGAPRCGVALLSGLVVCGRCGRQLQPWYRRKWQPCYRCTRHLVQGTEEKCYGLKAQPLDELVTREVLRALEPAALELSVQALRARDTDRARLDRHWQQRLERARYEVEQAERQYQAVEPENRLVARTLERHWEEALRNLRQVEEDYDRFRREQPPELAPEEAARLTALAADIPALWGAPGTTAADRKEVIRCLVERVVVQVRPDSEYVGVTIHWQGGCTSSHEIVRPVGNYRQLRDFAKLRDRLAELCRAGASSPQIADCLNREGFSTPHRRGGFFPELVRRLIGRFGLGEERAAAFPLGAHEWRLPELAQELGVRENKLRSWVVRGWLHRRQVGEPAKWIVWADREELRRLRKLTARSTRGVVAHPAALTTPKPRPERRTEPPQRSKHSGRG